MLFLVKPGIHKLTTSRGQGTCALFLFLLAAKKKAFIVSFRWDTTVLGHQNFDCRSYCGLSRHIQGVGGLHRFYWCYLLFATASGWLTSILLVLFVIASGWFAQIR